MKSKRVSPRGIIAIAQHEGIVPAPYIDSVGVWTFGVGHTAAAGAPNPSEMPKGIPQDIDSAIEKALRVFKEDLRKYEVRVSEAVKVPIKQHQFDALVSFDFNTGGIYRAKLTKHLNAGRLEDAADGFFGWLLPPEIKGRRSDEKHLFETGRYPEKLVPVWNVDKRGRLKSPLYNIGSSQLLNMIGVDTGPVAQWGGWKATFKRWFKWGS